MEYVKHSCKPVKAVYKPYADEEELFKLDCNCDTHPILKEIYEDVHANQLRIFGAMWGDNINTVVTEYSKLIGVEITETLQTVNFKHHVPLHTIDKERTRQEAMDTFLYALAQATCLFKSYEEFIRYLTDKVDKANQK